MMPLTLSGSVIVGIGSLHLREPTWLGRGKPTLSAASMMSDALSRMHPRFILLLQVRLKARRRRIVYRALDLAEPRTCQSEQPCEQGKGVELERPVLSMIFRPHSLPALPL